MKRFIIHTLRIISYIALPMGEYLTVWPISSPSLGIFLQPIIPTNLVEQIAVIVVLIILPILTIFFLHPSKETLTRDNALAVSNMRFGVIRRPTLKELFMNSTAIVAVSIIEAIPAILWTIIVLTLFTPSCWKEHLSLNELYCLIRR